MAYNKNSWQDGDIITAEKLNHMEDGIEAAGGLTNDVKTALLQIAEKVAYIDEHGQDYYDDLYDALYPSASLVSISAVYTQSGTVYPTTSLSALKDDLVVTAYYDDTSSEAVPAADYMLSGALTVGTSVITASYNGKTATFNVTVSAVPTVSSISAVYTQSGTVYDTDSLDSLKADLVVTATYSDSSTATVPSTDYTLSGTLTVGTSSITVSYEGETTTFSVTVTSNALYVITPDDINLMKKTAKNNNYPYYASNNSRISYVAFDLIIEEGKTYRAVAESSYNTAFMGIQIVSAAGLEQVSNHTSITQNVNDYDPGWQSLDYTFTPPAGFGTCALRFTFKQDSSGSGTISDNFVISKITVTDVTAPKQYLYNWDFTQSLTDSVEGKVATLTHSSSDSNDATRTSAGVVFDSESELLYLGDFGTNYFVGKEIEIDVAEFDGQIGVSAQHYRFVMMSGNSAGNGPLIYRKDTGWSGYSGSWGNTYGADVSGANTTALNYFSGKTIKIKFDSTGKPSLYVDNVLIGSINIEFSGATAEYLYLGGISTGANYCYNMTISGLRISEGA